MEKLLKNEIQTSYWYLYEYIGILMMLPFLGAIARNVDLDCMKYFLGLVLSLKSECLSSDSLRDILCR